MVFASLVKLPMQSTLQGHTPVAWVCVHHITFMCCLLLWCLCIYIYIYIYTHIYSVYIYIYTHIERDYIYIYTHTHIHTYIYIYICCLYTYIYIYILLSSFRSSKRPNSCYHPSGGHRSDNLWDTQLGIIIIIPTLD